MNEIKVKDSKAFVDDFLTEYLSNGMGAMPKREVDILVMGLLEKYAELDRQNNYDLSILLQMTESQVKSLRYVAKLKYPPKEGKYIETQFLIVLAKSQFDIDKGKIVFIMENSFVRHAVQGRLKAKGMFADSSFNSEIVKIDHEALGNLIADMYGREVAKEFRSNFTRLLNKEKGIDYDNLKTKFIQKAVETLGGAIPAAGLAYLKTLVPF
ncbi:MAG: hypothetical protein JNM02_07325 [Anaerolineales bacterium]|nr:hypothetical protein [Anaerolineales bacterium]